MTGKPVAKRVVPDKLHAEERADSLLSSAARPSLLTPEARGILSHQLLVKRDFVALGSGTHSHQVLVFSGKPVASASGISQCVFIRLL